MRPAQSPKKEEGNKTKPRRTADNLERAMESVNWEDFSKLVASEARKLKPGQETGWNPGILPNGLIDTSGKFIPAPVEMGNIDLSNREPIRLNDGSSATIRSISGLVDGKEVLIPTIGPKGENWDPSTEEGKNAAWDEYFKTGKHLGKFNNAEEADVFAEWLHEQEETRIEDKPTPTPKPPTPPAPIAPTAPPTPPTAPVEPTPSPTPPTVPPVKPAPKPPVGPKERGEGATPTPKPQAPSDTPTERRGGPVEPEKPSLLLNPPKNTQSPPTTKPGVQFNPPRTTVPPETSTTMPQTIQEKPKPKIGTPSIQRPPDNAGSSGSEESTVPKPKVGTSTPPNQPPKIEPQIGTAVSNAPPKTNKPQPSQPTPSEVDNFKEYVRSRMDAYEEEKTKRDARMREEGARRAAKYDKEFDSGPESGNQFENMPDDGTYSYKKELSYDDVVNELIASNTARDKWNSTNNPAIGQLWKTDSVKNLSDGEVILLTDLPEENSSSMGSGLGIPATPYAAVTKRNGLVYAVELNKDEYDDIKNGSLSNKNSSNPIAEQLGNMPRTMKAFFNTMPEDKRSGYLNQITLHDSPNLNNESIGGIAMPWNSSFSSFAGMDNTAVLIHETGHMIALAEKMNKSNNKDTYITPYHSAAVFDDTATDAYENAIEEDNKVSKEILTSSEKFVSKRDQLFSDASWEEYVNENIAAGYSTREVLEDVYPDDEGDMMVTPDYKLNPRIAGDISQIGDRLHGIGYSDTHITKYAEMNIDEDWAESFMYYSADKMYGYLATTDDGKKLRFADVYPNRAKIINEWMERKSEYDLTSR